MGALNVLIVAAVLMLSKDIAFNLAKKFFDDNSHTIAGKRKKVK
ncbi:hypothetical protein ACIOBL_01420 [Paenibacillus taichungensis]